MAFIHQQPAMKFSSIAAISLVLGSFASAIELPAIGSLDETTCSGGTIIDASLLNATKTNVQVLSTKVQCPLTSQKRSTSLALSRFSTRQADECDTSCSYTCTATTDGPVLSDCVELYDALIEIVEDDGIEDLFDLNAGQSLQYRQNTCLFTVTNTETEFYQTFCRTMLASIGEQLAEDCSSHAAVCTSGTAWKISVTEI